MKSSVNQYQITTFIDNLHYKSNIRPLVVTRFESYLVLGQLLHNWILSDYLLFLCYTIVVGTPGICSLSE